MSSREGEPKSSLVVRVPEAEVPVKEFRDRYDPSAAEGMPAHITLLYPFCPPNDLDESHIDGLRTCFETFPPFHFALRTTNRFGDAVLYLTPEPSQPFEDLTTAIWERFPKFPPYGGMYSRTIPHLTVAHIENDKDTLDGIERAFTIAARGKLAVHAKTSQVDLMTNAGGRWTISASFPLGLKQ